MNRKAGPVPKGADNDLLAEHKQYFDFALEKSFLLGYNSIVDFMTSFLVQMFLEVGQ